MPKFSKGFTLIELLVVISILAILSSIGLITYTSVQKNGRDAVRRDQIQSIAQAVEAKRSEDSTYNFTLDDLKKEFADKKLATTAQLGKDPSGSYYCFKSSTETTDPGDAPAADSDAFSGTTCATDWSYFSDTTSIAAAKSWTLCANLESSTEPFCWQSLSK